MSKLLTVGYIDNQGDRILLYARKGADYHVMASKNVTVEVGDIIAYEPDGYNFGWYINTVPQIVRGALTPKPPSQS